MLFLSEPNAHSEESALGGLADAEMKEGKKEEN